MERVRLRESPHGRCDLPQSGSRKNSVTKLVSNAEFAEVSQRNKVRRLRALCVFTSANSALKTLLRLPHPRNRLKVSGRQEHTSTQRKQVSFGFTRLRCVLVLRYIFFDRSPKHHLDGFPGCRCG
jgi:hypothetical protein